MLGSSFDWECFFHPSCPNGSGNRDQIETQRNDPCSSKYRLPELFFGTKSRDDTPRLSVVPMSNNAT